MKKCLFTPFFIAIALLTSASVFAQSADTTLVADFDGANSSYYELSLDRIIHNDDADLESRRENHEVSRQELSEITNDKRFTGRQFNFYKR
ncbi:Uncharacterised protein [Providencia rustigianii]|uniref:Uncharacterized protein n=2 Tax=Providencia rustigianii TaxID=158850 RepID=D1NYE4_9GAMM|nr:MULTISPECIES: hypothetical protein [Providencia]EFB73992.1 hypothetical protein PROVRUST_05274 [Providencia rustigianii DSM 4541]MTC57160.1 hypothetical protein [Providencia rustigianii]MTC60731.1 hypothetical protein [Providencia rustigianii]SPY77275.1 Uncharacterised protein [Providencia rustigianii]SUC26643.1 Uncharacterised protein [Providencia rustigianii]